MMMQLKIIFRKSSVWSKRRKGGGKKRGIVCSIGFELKEKGLRDFKPNAIRHQPTFETPLTTTKENSKHYEKPMILPIFDEIIFQCLLWVITLVIWRQFLSIGVTSSPNL